MSLNMYFSNGEKKVGLSFITSGFTLHTNSNTHYDVLKSYLEIIVQWKLCYHFFYIKVLITVNITWMIDLCMISFNWYCFQSKHLNIIVYYSEPHREMVSVFASSVVRALVGSNQRPKKLVFVGSPQSK
jgi:hypothetical protein